MKEKDPSAKALVFTQFRDSMTHIEKALKAEGIQLQMVRRRTLLQSSHFEAGARLFESASASLTLPLVSPSLFDFA